MSYNEIVGDVEEAAAAAEGKGIGIVIDGTVSSLDDFN